MTMKSLFSQYELVAHRRFEQMAVLVDPLLQTECGPFGHDPPLSFAPQFPKTPSALSLSLAAGGGQCASSWQWFVVGTRRESRASGQAEKSKSQKVKTPG